MKNQVNKKRPYHLLIHVIIMLKPIDSHPAESSSNEQFISNQAVTADPTESMELDIKF